MPGREILGQQRDDAVSDHLRLLDRFWILARIGAAAHVGAGRPGVEDRGADRTDLLHLVAVSRDDRLERCLGRAVQPPIGARLAPDAGGDADHAGLLGFSQHRIEPARRIIRIRHDLEAFAIELGVAFLVDRRLLRRRELALHPDDQAIDILRRDIRALELFTERLRIGEELGPIERDVIGALARALDQALERDAHVDIELGLLLQPAVHPGQPRHERALDQAVPLVERGR